MGANSQPIAQIRSSSPHMETGAPDVRTDNRLSLDLDAVAVVGFALRFPGRVNDAASFWHVLRDGIEAVGDTPSSRWPAEKYLDPEPGSPGKMITIRAGYINDVELFDADFFGISPREATAMDPQQRLLLELSWHALEDAGLAPDQLRDSETGTFIGICSNDYAALQRPLDNLASIGPYFGTGTACSFAAGRLSYVLGLQGPSFAVDTACSSSLVAIHLACRSLLDGECDLALAGGVNLILSPLGGIYVSQIRSASPRGRCCAFDASADGYVRG